MHYIKLILAIIFTNLFSCVYAFADQNIAYTDVGEGQPLVLIHAFPTDQRLWKPQQTALQQHFRVISLDLPGFGASATTDGKAITMNQYADEVKMLLDRLHISNAIVGGESMGGYVALAFLQKYPDMTTGLILSDTQSISDTLTVREKREATAKQVLAQGSDQLVAEFLPKALSPSANAETRTTLLAMMKTQSTQGIASALLGMALREDTSNVIRDATIPILIITGDQDKVIAPEQSQHMFALNKLAKLKIIKDAGHLSNLEQPQQWNQAVLSMFMKS